MTVGILLSVRAKSTRLRGKVFKPLYDGNVTQFLLRRLAMSTRADVLVLTTSTDPQDNELVDLAQRERVLVFRGSAEDKLLRYRDAARRFGLNYVVIVDGDDPFVSITHIDQLVDFVNTQPDRPDLVSFANLPLGAAAWGLAVSALETICHGRAESNTEVWGAAFRNDNRFNIVDLHEADVRLARPDVRMTLDYEADYSFFSSVADALKSVGRYPTFEAVMDYLSDQPAAIALNRDVQAAYEAHLQRSIAAVL